MSEQDDTTQWVEVRATVNAERVAPSELEAFLEPLCAVARTLSPGGVVIEGEDAPPGQLPPPPPGHSRVRVWVPSDTADEAAALVREAAVGGGYEGARVETEALDPGWRDRWKEGFRGFLATPRLWVRPPWEAPGPPPHAAPGVVEVIIEPGMAFGTGQHETTRLCLDAVDTLTAPPGEPPAALLDVGCGTGIVSIAAARLGVARVRGVDIAPEAIRAAHENAEANGFAPGEVGMEDGEDGGLLLDGTPLAQLREVYPVVIANILAHLLVPLRDDVVSRVGAGGALFITGLLESQEEEVASAFEVDGLHLVGRAQRGEWVRLDFERTR